MNILKIASVLGFLGICLGAMGAHALEPRLELLGTLANWKTAALYHLIHSACLFALGLNANRFVEKGINRVAVCWSVGILFFSGSLYLMSLFSFKFLWPITPLGGLFFLVGWCFVFFLKRK